MQNEAGQWLATVNYVKATMVNGGERYYHTRDYWVWLTECAGERFCYDCQRPLVRYETVARSGYVMYCLSCVAWMSEEDATHQAQVKTCPPEEVARLRQAAPHGGKQMMVVAREIRHEVSLAKDGTQ